MLFDNVAPRFRKLQVYRASSPLVPLDPTIKVSGLGEHQVPLDADDVLAVYKVNGTVLEPFSTYDLRDQVINVLQDAGAEVVLMPHHCLRLGSDELVVAAVSGFQTTEVNLASELGSLEFSLNGLDYTEELAVTPGTAVKVRLKPAAQFNQLENVVLTCSIFEEA